MSEITAKHSVDETCKRYMTNPYFRSCLDVLDKSNYDQGTAIGLIGNLCDTTVELQDAMVQANITLPKPIVPGALQLQLNCLESKIRLSTGVPEELMQDRKEQLCHHLNR